MARISWPRRDCKLHQTTTRRKGRSDRIQRCTKPISNRHHCPPASILHQELPRRRSLRHSICNVHGSRHHDGHSLATLAHDPILHTAIHQRHLLWLRIHVLHGGGIRTRVPGRPRNVHQGACQWSLRRHGFHGGKLSHRIAVSIFHPRRLLCNSVLPDKLPTHRRRFLYLGDVAIPRSSGWGILGGAHVFYFPQFRHRTCADCIR